MIRPCDDCDGYGRIRVKYEEKGRSGKVRCLRCPDMPWLTCQATNTFGHGTWHDSNCDGAKFKPDPDTVMQWCFTHDSPLDGIRPFPSHCQYRGTVSWRKGSEAGYNLIPCDFGWVERPTRLEVVE